ncbi:diphosphomevalonate decarboxylase [Aquimarina sp. EL_43]|uniref:diphosphomevalonate/mevalonate 3,5-bisphosphate decarboxylase family protein n=1 Tax=unclassified Aquimarina TaxID=2627091 RepID=UPI0018CBC299|nr:MULTISPECIES: diphosphomevalonate decarboxylase [unclassified Aquimarina]MBG6130468.1 diphosphomevalonate decarboxylase [Aquimarina sp. EL_35]MBG6149248.1 diphosphomevalonate decarboxylase [Aquimarina sp. EL_32]MBG6168378.1 diphosphomevalonate decarboxylase [Aquimarina sp. EL_43]
MSDYPEFTLPIVSKLPEEGIVTCTSPSNIALVKYWGKKPVQLPENASISFTLDNCKTTTSLAYKRRDDAGEDFDFELFFEGKPKPDFKPKIQSFFERIQEYLPFLKQYTFRIETSNTFPHSSGIASSASGMSALAYCLMQLEKKINPDISDSECLQKSSFLARLGSGSACRSIEGPVTVWGEHSDINESSDAYAIPFPFPVHQNFNDYQDTILLIDKGEKQVSSSVGHNLMYGHPFAEKRFEQATGNVTKLKEILISGDLDAFIKIVESEALTLHAMMMTSLPYFILMKPNTLSVIHKIWEYRATTGSKVCFTLDAGANVHVLYPNTEKNQVLDFITNELVAYCQNGQYICDKIGLGAKIV